MTARLPVPKNKILLFTLAGALLTSAVAVGLAYPELAGSTATETGPSSASGSETLDAADVPEPNRSFTPQVANRRYGEEEEHELYEERYEEDDEHEERYEEEGGEREEWEERYEEAEDEEEYE